MKRCQMSKSDDQKIRCENKVFWKERIPEPSFIRKETVDNRHS